MGSRTLVAPTAGLARLVPIDGGGLRITGGLWAGRQSVIRQHSLPHGHRQLEASGALGNFRNAARGTGLYVGGSDDAGTTFPFLDSDVYKWLEAVGWELGREADPALAADADAVIAAVTAAQRPDGYLNTYVQLSGRRAWSDLQWGHELYCVGHLVQAAVAWHRALDDDRLLAVAERAVGVIDGVLGPGGSIDGVDGHPELEMALVELYRVTGRDGYLALARHLIERRGHGLLGPGRFGADYWQDRLPVRSAPTVTGHAVRQMYLDAGAVDVAVETDDSELLAAVVRRWDEMRATRSYLTGGIGSHHRDEAFGAPFELPPERAYTETCAAIGLVMLAWRLLLATGEERFADVIDRQLLNAVLSGLAIDGLGFAYVNPLQRRTSTVARPRPRQPWHPCACCPPNIMRTVASVEQLIATATGDGLRLHQYATGTIETRLGDDPVALQIVTDYPWDGRVEVTVTATPSRPWTLGLRVPGWCHETSISVGDVRLAATVVDGRIDLPRSWTVGERLVLELGMPVRFTVPDPRIDAIRGCVAIERGPLVYCLEAADLPEDVTLEDVTLDLARPPRLEPGRDAQLGTRAISVGLVHHPRPATAWPYRDEGSPADGATGSIGAPLEVRLHPYQVWSNRTDGAMRVWIPVETSAGSGRS